MSSKTPWYRRIPYVTKDRPKGYLIIPRQNKKTGQNRPVEVCIPIRKAAIKIYCMNNPHLVLAGYDVGRDVEAVLIGYILGNEYLTQQQPYFYEEG